MAQPRGVHRAIFIVAAAFCLSPWGSPAIGLGLGIALGILLTNPWPRESRRVSKLLLQACVVLLGFGMDFGVVIRAGAEGAVLAAVTITMTLSLGLVIGHWLSIAGRTSTLISGGTAICGGSAIAALAAVIGAAEAEIAVAIATVFVLNAAGLYLFPFLGHLLELSPAQFGVWAGVSIHDVSSVVGAASAYSPEALEVATAVKLSRTLWIIPLSIGALIVMRWRAARTKVASNSASSSPEQPPLQIPWFIGLFLLASISRGIFSPVEAAAPTLVAIAKSGLALTLFLIGAGITMSTLRTVGWRPMVQGVILWVFISLTTLGFVLARG